MLSKKKIYMGCVRDEEIAARVYDVAVIQNRGLAKINHRYTVAFVLACFFQDSVIEFHKMKDREKVDQYLTDFNQ